MKTNSGIQTKERHDEVPNFIIRLRKQKGQEHFMYVDELSPVLVTIVPEEATRYTESEARLTLAIRAGVSVHAWELLRGAKVLPAEKMLEEEVPKMIIRFHVSEGKSYEDGKEIAAIVRAIIQGQYPDAEIQGNHWHSGVRTFCHVAHYAPLTYPQAERIEQQVMETIQRIAQRVPTREMQEVYDYA